MQGTKEKEFSGTGQGPLPVDDTLQKEADND